MLTRRRIAVAALCALSVATCIAQSTIAFTVQAADLTPPRMPDELSLKSHLLTDPPMLLVSKLTRDEVVKTPAWERGSEYPPLSPRKAEALALSMLDKIMGQRYWGTPVISMRAFDVTQRGSKHREVRWIYVLQFRLLSLRANEGGYIDIVVLMNGKVIEPRCAN